MAILAQDEREKTSQRTKAALAELKRKGKKLGTPENLTEQARTNSLQVRQQNAMGNENNRQAGALIVSFRKEGKSFYQITKELNSLGFKTRTGKTFQQNQIQILYNRYRS
jgi:Recombinase.